MSRQSPSVQQAAVADGFLKRYFEAFDQIPGWLSPDAYLMVAAYSQLLARAGLAQHVLEIGVYHGKSAIGFAALRGSGSRFVAVDLFDKPPKAQMDRLWFGSRERFLQNMARFHHDPSFVTTIAAPSASLRPRDVGSAFTLCHIDGGHTSKDVHADLTLCAAVVKPGGLVVLDDFSSPAFPGVAEGALRFNLDSPGTLRPVAIGFNKAIFQREPAPFDLNARFFETFPHVCSQWASIWDVQVPLFDTSLGTFFDTASSTPGRLAPRDGSIAARIEPVSPTVRGAAGASIDVPIKVTNLSRMALSCEHAPFGLSYHLRTADQALMKYDNPRTYFTVPLAPNDCRLLTVPVSVPDEPGRYELEFDIVWEGVLWMKNLRNPTATVSLTAVADGAVPRRARNGVALA